jgi:hypothetical protein
MHFAAACSKRTFVGMQENYALHGDCNLYFMILPTPVNRVSTSFSKGFLHGVQALWAQMELDQERARK